MSRRPLKTSFAIALILVATLGLIGSAASNGCVRMPNEVVTLLAETIPAGTPVTVRA